MLRFNRLSLSLKVYFQLVYFLRTAVHNDLTLFASMIAQLALALTFIGTAITAAPTSQPAVFGAWVASWNQQSPVTPASEFTELSYFAMVTTSEGVKPDGSPAVFSGYAKGVQDQLLSLGGWGGSQYVRQTVRSIA